MPTDWPHLPPKKYSWYSFLLEAEDPRTIVWPEGLCQWKIPVTPLWIKPLTFRLVVHFLNQMHHLVPDIRYGFKLKTQLLCFFQLQARYDDDTGTAKLRTEELESEQETLLKDMQLLTTEAKELKIKLQVFRKHIVDLTPNITTEWYDHILRWNVVYLVVVM